MNQKTLDQLAEEFKSTEEVIHFEPRSDTDSAVKFKEVVAAHGHEIDRDTAQAIIGGYMTAGEMELRKQLRTMINNKSQVLFDKHGNECTALPATDVMRAVLEDPEFILLSGHIRSMMHERTWDRIKDNIGTTFMMQFPVPEKSNSINLGSGERQSEAGSMNINAEEGDKVVFAFPDAGMDNGAYAAKHLELGKTYTVKYVDIGGWQSDVYLKEIPDKSFNSVHFADVEISN
jgi:hypothetical protein